MTPEEIQKAVESFVKMNQSFEVRSGESGFRCIFKHIGDVWHMMFLGEKQVAKSLCGTSVMVDADSLDRSSIRIAVTEAGLLCGWLSVHPENIIEIVPAEVARWSGPNT